MEKADLHTTTFGIVEDELIESEAMACFITRTFPEAKIIWSVQDGASALEAVHYNVPDILIVDIEMPIMNGLDLCEHLYEEKYDGVILINTAYDKFSYAKKAIRFNAFDYIVKPVNNNELNSAISRCIEEARRKIKENKQQEDISELFQDIGQYAISLLTNKQQKSKEISQAFKTIGWPEQEEFKAYVLHIYSRKPYSAEEIRLFKELQQSLAEANYLFITDYIDNKHIIAIVQPNEKISLPHWYTIIWCFALSSVRILKNSIVKVSSICRDMNTISHECDSADIGSDQFPERIIDRIEIPARTWCIIRKKDAEKYRNIFERYFRDGLFDRARSLVKECMHPSESMDNDVFWEISLLVLSAAACVWPNANFESLVQEMFELPVSPSEWFDVFFNFCIKLPKPQTGDAIDTVIELMKTSFSQDITQTLVAEKLGCSPAYFSRMFKKRTGQNFSDMLTDIRMQHAEKMLLENPNCSLEELCESCGLSSKTYFSEVFKKWKGMTITQFLKNQ